jgi:hypothetical protein
MHDYFVVRTHRRVAQRGRAVQGIDWVEIRRGLAQTRDTGGTERTRHVSDGQNRTFLLR